MTPVRKVAIDPRRMSGGRFALSGEVGKTRYHVWVNDDLTLEPDAVIHANMSDPKAKRNYRSVGIKTKLGSVILKSMMEQAKCCGLIELALSKAKILEANQAHGAAKRAKARADKERIHNTLVFIAKTIRNPRCATHDDPCLIELKDKATKVLVELEL